jgi:succinate dehydrogenase / fumarate reductase flavoprotein subunit
MFRYVPERFASETADTEEEAERWLAGDPEARRPPELLTRDVVAMAITAEVKAGRGSTNGGAYLDIATRRDAEFIKKKLPSMYHQFRELAEVDITKQSMQVGPTLHYFMGGIRVDADSQMSRVQGLFACGECCAGLHGANRLGGNSLSDLLVFGKLAGDGAAAYVQGLHGEPRVSDTQVSGSIRAATGLLNRESGPNPFVLHDRLQEVMGEYVGIVRSDEGLSTGIGKLDELAQEIDTVKAHGSCQFNAGWHEALDLSSLVTTAQAVARAACMRQESRGAHTRVDFEGEHAEWGNKNVVIRKGLGGEMEVREEVRPDPPEELAKIARASIEDVLEGRV